MDTYQSLCAKFYEADKPEAPQEALHFYEAYAKKSDGKILEPMCGTGSYLPPLLNAGLDIIGFDGSEAMLKTMYTHRV